MEEIVNGNLAKSGKNLELHGLARTSQDHSTLREYNKLQHQLLRVQPDGTGNHSDNAS